MTTTERPEISVIIPCLNEEANAAAIAQAVIDEVTKETQSYELLFIDNSSTDATVAIIKGLCAQNPRIRLIVNNKNYGQMRSPTYGIYQTRGAAVIGICADFQDPPQMIGAFIRRWRAGAHIVLGVRETENSSLAVSVLRSLGYDLLSRFGDYPIVRGATGFGLYSREVVDCLSAWNEPQPFFRGMLVESGFRLETIPYHRPRRQRGFSKNNLLTSADFALAALSASSKNWLRLPIYLSLVLFSVGALGLAAALIGLAFGQAPWTALLLSAAVFGFAGLFFFLGLIGDQVRLISERTRNVPLVVEKERVNF